MYVQVRCGESVRELLCFAFATNAFMLMNYVIVFDSKGIEGGIACIQDVADGERELQENLMRFKLRKLFMLRRVGLFH